MFGSIVGIAGFVLAIIFYVRGKKIRRLSAESTSTVVVGAAGEADDRLKIVFDEHEVPRVTRSVFVLWNSGHETIRGNDVAISDPIRVEFPSGTTILAANIERITRDSINAQILQTDPGDPPSVRLTFDFIDRNDGILYSIMHTAATGQGALRGTIQGIPGGITLWDSMLRDLESYRVVRSRRRTKYWLLWELIKRTFLTAAAVFPPFLLISGLFSGLALRVLPSLGEPDMSAVLVAGKFNYIYIFFGTLFGLIEYFFIRSWWRRPPKTLVNPKISS
jgi:hypothetical protein